MKNYFPVYLNLAGKRVLVVGGGSVGTRKIRNLLKLESEVVVISPEISEAAQHWVMEGSITWESRVYNQADVENAAIIFAATDNPELNHRIAEDAHQANVPVNVVTEIDNNDFIVPAKIRRGNFSLAISTDGCAPAFAAELRKKLEHEYDHYWGEVIQVLDELRDWLRKTEPDTKKRQKIMKDISKLTLVDEIKQLGAEALKEKLLEQIKTKLN